MVAVWRRNTQDKPLPSFPAENNDLAQVVSQREYRRVWRPTKPEGHGSVAPPKHTTGTDDKNLSSLRSYSYLLPYAMYLMPATVLYLNNLQKFQNLFFYAT